MNQLHIEVQVQHISLENNLYLLENKIQAHIYVSLYSRLEIMLEVALPMV